MKSLAKLLFVFINASISYAQYGIQEPQGCISDNSIRIEKNIEILSQNQEQLPNVRGFVYGFVNNGLDPFSDNIILNERITFINTPVKIGNSCYLTNDNGYFEFNATNGSELKCILQKSGKFGIYSGNISTNFYYRNASFWPYPTYNLFYFNLFPEEFSYARMSAYYWLDKTYHSIENIYPNDIPFARIRVNTSQANLQYMAFIKNNEIQLSRHTVNQPNLAYSTIIVHEYAHLLSHWLNPETIIPEIDEPLADTFASIICNTPIIGAKFYNNTPLRNLEGSHSWPINSNNVHEKGAPLSESLWQLKNCLELGIASAPYDQTEAQQIMLTLILHAMELNLQLNQTIGDDFVNLDKQIYNGQHVEVIKYAFKSHNLISN